MIESHSSPFSPLTWTSGGRPYLLIAGPCSAETKEQTLSTARALHAQGIRYFRASLWKPRTRPGGFEGVGYAGLSWLRQVETELSMTALTEVATPAHIEACLAVGIRSLWIGARTTSSPFAMTEIAEALRGVDDVTLLVKNPINPDISLWEGALLRLYHAGIRQIGAIHRGFSTYADTGYRNSPLWQIPIELKRRHPGLTLIADPSHIGGQRALIASLSRSALEMHFDGLMIETHNAPDNALSDAKQQITPSELAELLQHIGTPLMSTPPSAELNRWREMINHIDSKLLELLAQRNEVIQAIGAYKQQHNLCILQPERYRELMNSRQEMGASLGLSPSYVHDLYSIIHEESIHLQQASTQHGD